MAHQSQDRMADLARWQIAERVLDPIAVLMPQFLRDRREDFHGIQRHIPRVLNFNFDFGDVMQRHMRRMGDPADDRLL